MKSGFGVLLNFSDPGYTVFKPLLIFNGVMGVVYLITGLVIWRNIKQGIKVSNIVVILNLSVLILISILYKTSQDIVAVNSLYAMSFRTIVWIVIYFGLSVIKKKSSKN